MSRGIIVDHALKVIIEKIQKKARELEKELPKEDFTAYYTKGYIFFWFVFFIISLSIAIITSLLYMECLIFFGIFAALALLAFLYHLTYQATVNTEGMTVKRLFVFKKNVCWKDVAKVEIKQFKGERDVPEKEVLIRGKNNKLLFACSHELVGFTNIVRMANKYRKKR